MNFKFVYQLLALSLYLSSSFQVTDLISKRLSDRGMRLQQQGRYLEAEFCLRIAIFSARQGRTSDVRLANSLDALAQNLRVQDRSVEAIGYITQALSIRIKLRESNRIEIAKEYLELGMLKMTLGHLDEVEPLILRAKHVFENMNMDKVENIGYCNDALAYLYLLQDKRDLMLKIVLETFRLRESELGVSHVEVAKSWELLAAYYVFEDNLLLAEECGRRALWIAEKYYKPNHPGTITHLYNISNTLLLKGNPSEAEKYAKKALDLSEKCYGGQHRKNIDLLLRIARAKYMQAKYNDAEKYVRHAIEIQEFAYGKTSKVLIPSLEFHATILMRAERELESSTVWNRVNVLKNTLR